MIPIRRIIPNGSSFALSNLAHRSHFALVVIRSFCKECEFLLSRRKTAESLICSQSYAGYENLTFGHFNEVWRNKNKTPHSK